MNYLVDTNIFIYHFNGDGVATAFLEEYAGEYALSFVTFIELFSFPNIDTWMSDSIRRFLEDVTVEREKL